MKYEIDENGLMYVELKNGCRIFIREDSVHIMTYDKHKLVNHNPENNDLWVMVLPIE